MSAWLFWVVVAMAGLALIGFRILAASGDYWLDEILSLQALRKISLPSDLFTGLHSDNNHYLNSLWLNSLPASASPLLGRLLSLVSGIGVVVMAVLIGARRSRLCAVFSGAVMGFSYIEILYSSEARGYALAVFAGFASFYVMGNCLREWRVRRAIVFSLLACLGLLAHLSFTCVVAAFGAWLAVTGLQQRWQTRRWIWRMLQCFALPAVVGMALYFLDVRKMSFFGGTDSTSLIHAYGSALAWIVGTPRPGPCVFLALVVAVVVLDAGLHRLWRTDRAEAVFFAMAIFVMPVGQAVISSVHDLYPRYFVVGGSFLLLLLAGLLCDLYEKRGYARIGSFAVLLLFAVVNADNTLELLRLGRGQNREALAYVVGHTAGGAIRVGGNHDFRIGTVVEQFAPEFSAGGVSLTYVDRDGWPPEGPEWFIVQAEAVELPIPPERRFFLLPGVSYTFDRAFPSAPLSGLHWYLYRRDR